MDLGDSLMRSPLLQDLQAIVAGAKSLPDSEAKRHHLIPEFILRRFAREIDGRERLLQLDVASGKPQWTEPRTAASQRRFYALADAEGNRHNLFEGYLALVEGHAAPVIDRLCNGSRLLNTADRATLAYFFALLEGRTLGGIERLERFGEETMKSLLASDLADTHTFAKRYREIVNDASEDDIEEFRRSVLEALAQDRIGVSNPRAMALEMLQRAVGSTFQLVFQLRWHLLESDGFVTSDRGIAMHDPDPPHPWTGHAWLSSASAETTIPLDPGHCLRFSPSPHGPTREFASYAVEPDEVEAINLRTYGFASSYVFSHSQEVATQLRRVARRRPRQVIKPRPNRNVLLIETDPNDTRLAREHRARGWPAYLPYDGELHDYVVLDPQGDPIEQSIDASLLGQKRAVSRLGTEDVRSETIPLDPRRFG